MDTHESSEYSPVLTTRWARRFIEPVLGLLPTKSGEAVRSRRGFERACLEACVIEGDSIPSRKDKIHRIMWELLRRGNIALSDMKSVKLSFLRTKYEPSPIVHRGSPGSTYDANRPRFITTITLTFPSGAQHSFEEVTFIPDADLG